MRRLLLGLAASFGAVLMLAGCGRGSFVGRGADNFSAYYNTFYNAEKSFNKGLKALEKDDQVVDQTRYLSVFREPARNAPPGAFKKAIEKSADVLRDHPRSKWVDDALMLIGKSYYYQGNYVGAEQKFGEVLGQEDSELKEEARLWLARTLTTAGRYGEADQVIAESLSGEGGAAAERTRARLYLARGGLQVQQGRFDEAEVALEKGLQDLADDRLQARAHFLHGQVLETLERHEAAARAYRRAADERPPYELAYAAKTSALRMQGRSDRAEAALQDLRSMRRDDKNADRRDELVLLRGEIYQAQGRPNVARQAYTGLLYDRGSDHGSNRRSRVSGSVRGRAHYALATLYRDAYDDFTRAAAHFDTAATALGQTGGAVQQTPAASRPTPYAITDSRVQARQFAEVAAAARAFSRLDSLLRLGTMSRPRFEAYVDSVRRSRARSQRARARQKARQRAEARFRRGGQQETQRRRSGQRTTAAAAAAGGEASFLFHRSPARVQESKAAFARAWGERPRVPNWRRIRAISSEGRERVSGQPAEEVGAQGRGGTSGTVALPRVDVSAVPRSPERQAQMRAQRAQARYELGSALFLSAARPDSAASWFRRVIEKDGDQPVARRARYALAEAQYALGNRAAARQQYREVLSRYPDSELGRRARRRLAEEASGVQDTIAVEAVAGERKEAGRREAQKMARVGLAASGAEASYEAAYRQWQEGDYQRALEGMVETAARHPQTGIAPRALLAASRLYMEWARRERRNLFDPLPLRLGDSLFASGALFDADTTVVARASPTGELRLDELLAGLAGRYPQTPHARRARYMLQALKEHRSALPALLAAVEDRPLQREQPRSGEGQGATAIDSIEGLRSVEEASAEETPLRGSGGLDREEGGWTLVVSSKAARSQADSVADRYRREGYRVGVLAGPSEEGIRHRVGVGQFATRDAVAAAKRRLAPQGEIPRTAWFLRIKPASPGSGEAERGGAEEAEDTDDAATPAPASDSLAAPDDSLSTSRLDR